MPRCAGDREDAVEPRSGAPHSTPGRGHGGLRRRVRPSSAHQHPRVAQNHCRRWQAQHRVIDALSVSARQRMGARGQRGGRADRWRFSSSAGGSTVSPAASTSCSFSSIPAASEARSLGSRTTAPRSRPAMPSSPPATTSARLFPAPTTRMSPTTSTISSTHIGEATAHGPRLHRPRLGLARDLPIACSLPHRRFSNLCIRDSQSPARRRAPPRDLTPRLSPTPMGIRHHGLILARRFEWDPAR